VAGHPIRRQGEPHGLLAGLALLGGITKSFIPKEKLAAKSGREWTQHASVGFVETYGILELTAVVGLILPAALNIALVMVPMTRRVRRPGSRESGDSGWKRSSSQDMCRRFRP
jgi:hypothetical protein